MNFFDELLSDFVCEEVVGEYLWPYWEFLFFLKLNYRNSNTIEFCKKVSMDVREVWMWEDFIQSIMDRKKIFYPCSICMKEPLKRKLPRKNDKFCQDSVCKKIAEERDEKISNLEKNFDLRLLEFALKEECYACLNYFKKIHGSEMFIKRLDILSQTAATHWNTRPLKWLQKVVPNVIMWPKNLHIFAIMNGNMDLLKEIQNFLGITIFWSYDPFSVLIQTNNIEMADYIYDQMTQHIFSLYIACLSQKVEEFDLDEPVVIRQQFGNQVSYFRSFPIMIQSNGFEAEPIIEEEDEYPLDNFAPQEQEIDYDNTHQHQRIFSHEEIDSINEFLMKNSKNQSTHGDSENQSIDDDSDNLEILDNSNGSKELQKLSKKSSSQDINELVGEYYRPDEKWIPECDWRPVMNKKMKNIFEEREWKKNLCWKSVPIEERPKALKFLKQMLHLNSDVYKQALNLNRPAFFYWLTQQFIPFPMKSSDCQLLVNKNMDQFLNPSNPSIYDKEFIQEFTLHYKDPQSFDLDESYKNPEFGLKKINLFDCFSSFLLQKISMPDYFVRLLWNRGDFELLKELSLHPNSKFFWNKQLFIDASLRNERNLFAHLYELDQNRSQKLSVPTTKISIKCFLWAVENENYDFIRFLVKVAPQHVKNPKICNKVVSRGTFTFLYFLRNHFNPPFAWTEETSLEACMNKNLAMLSWMTSTKDPCPINYESCICTIKTQTKDSRTEQILSWLLQKAPKSCIDRVKIFPLMYNGINLHDVEGVARTNLHEFARPKKSTFFEKCIIC